MPVRSSTFGYLGHLLLPAFLRNVPEQRGFAVRKTGIDSYRVDLPPGLILDTPNGTGPVLGIEDLERQLNFMHKPVRFALGPDADKELYDAVIAAIRSYGSGNVLEVPPSSPVSSFSANSEDRGRIHAFGTAIRRKYNSVAQGVGRAWKGNVWDGDAPVAAGGADQDDSDEHVGVMRAIEEMHRARIVPEFAGRNAAGVHINVNRGVIGLTAEPPAGPANAALADRVRRTAGEVLGQRHVNGSITLTAPQFVEFVEALGAQNNLTGLARQATLESRTLAVLEEITQGRVLAPGENISLPALDAAAAKLSYVLTQADTPSSIWSSAPSFMKQNLWGRYYVSRRKDSPVPALQQDIEVLRRAIRQLGADGATDPARAVRLAAHFAPLLTFGARVESIMRKDKAAAVPKDAPELPRDQRDFLAALERSVSGKGASAVASMGRLLGNFGEDMWKEWRKHPYIATALVVSAYGAVRYLAPVNTSVPTPEYEYVIDEAFKVVSQATSQLTQDAIPKGAGCHIDALWNGTLKEHCLVPAAQKLKWFYDITRVPVNFVVGYLPDAAMKMLESSRDAQTGTFHFGETFRKTVDSVSSFLGSVNFWQNLSHAGYWVWSGLHGFTKGFLGFFRIFDMMAPLVDYTGSKILRAGKQDTAVAIPESQAPAFTETLARIPLPEKPLATRLERMRDAFMTAAEKTGEKVVRLPWKPIGCTATGVGTVVIGADYLGYIGQLPEQMQKVAIGLSQAYAVAAGTGISSGIFFVFNVLIDDIILVHVGTGAALMTAGSTVHYTAKPVVRTARATVEKLSFDDMERDPLREQQPT